MVKKKKRRKDQHKKKTQKLTNKLEQEWFKKKESDLSKKSGKIKGKMTEFNKYLQNKKNDPRTTDNFTSLLCCPTFLDL